MKWNQMKRNVTKCKFNNTWNDIHRCRTATILLNMNMHRLESAHKFSTKNNKILWENNNKNNNITEMRRSRKIRCQGSAVCVCVHKWIVFTSPGIFIYISIFLQLCSGPHFKLHGRFANMLVCVPKCPLLVFRTILFLFILAFFLEWCEL